MEKKYIIPAEEWLPENQVLPLKFRDIAEQVDEFKVLENDVWVVSFPKSGTHWMQEALCLLLHDSENGKIHSPNYKRSVILEASSFHACKDTPELSFEILSKHLKSLESPRVMKSHLFYDKLPKGLREPNSKAKIVYMARNPKDVCVSLFYYYQMMHPKEYHEITKSFEFFCGEFLENRVAFTPYWKHVFDYWNRRNQSNILFVRYEEMKKDMFQVLDKLQIFLNGEPLSQERKQNIADRLSFAKMKETKKVNYKKASFYRETYANSGGRANFMRKGEVGDWKTIMPPDLVKRFDDWIEENVAGTDYSVNGY